MPRITPTPSGSVYRYYEPQHAPQKEEPGPNKVLRNPVVTGRSSFEGIAHHCPPPPPVRSRVFNELDDDYDDDPDSDYENGFEMFSGSGSVGKPLVLPTPAPAPVPVPVPAKLQLEKAPDEEAGGDSSIVGAMGNLTVSSRPSLVATVSISLNQGWFLLGMRRIFAVRHIRSYS